MEISFRGVRGVVSFSSDGTWSALGLAVAGVGNYLVDVKCRKVGAWEVAAPVG